MIHVESECVEAGGEGEVPRLARAYGPDGTFLALVAYVPETGVWRPHKVFVHEVFVHKVVADANRKPSDSGQRVQER